MRIGCLQFAPQLGRVDENIARADELLAAASFSSLDLLVLPECAFTGYNHPSLPSILPYLEPTSAGPSTQWAIRTARTHNCLVTVGYPELFSSSPPKEPKPTMIKPLDETYTVTAYNSTVTVNPEGRIVSHCRKTHLYYTDETWAQESPQGFTTTHLTIPSSTFPPGRIKATFAICMDLNSHHFLNPQASYELSSHCLDTASSLLVLSTAWLTRLLPSALLAEPHEPDHDTWSCWFERLSPLMSPQQQQQIICVFANRSGSEPGKAHPDEEGEGEGVRYAGSSWIGRAGGGEVEIGGFLGRAEEGVLVVDTEQEMRWRVRIGEKDEAS